MSSKWKGRVALLVLGALLVGSGLVLGLSTPGRVRYWTWRMNSRDPETRALARRRLAEIGRPTIDRVFPRLVGSEARDRLNVLGTERLLVYAFVGRLTWRHATGDSYHIEEWLGPRAPIEGSARVGRIVPSDPIDELLACKTASTRKLIIGDYNYNSKPLPLDVYFELTLAEDDPLWPEVIAETRAALARP